MALINRELSSLSFARRVLALAEDPEQPLLERVKTPRSRTGRAYAKLIYFNEVDRGCHFAAWQEPALFAGVLRAAFRSSR